MMPVPPQLCLYGFMVIFSALAEIRQVTNSGREFIVTFMQHGIYYSSPELVITATQGPVTDVRISAPLRPDINATTQLTIVDTGVMHVVLNPELFLYDTQVTNNGVWITSPTNITVQCYSVCGYSSSEGFMAYPVESLEREYVVVTYCASDYLCEFAIVATEDKTAVSIFLTIDRSASVAINSEVYYNNSEMEISLDRYQAIQIQSKGDLTGTRILASAAVAVFSGSPVTTVWEENASSTATSANHLEEQLPPVSCWGNNYVISPFPNTQFDSFIKIVVNESTVVTMDKLQVSVPIYDRFTQYRLPKGSLTVVSSDRPILVAQFSQSVDTSSYYFENRGSFAILPAVSSWRQTYVFSALNFDSDFTSETNITIVTSQTCVDDVLLNGDAITSGWTVEYDNACTSFQLKGTVNILSVVSESCALYGTLIGQYVQTWSLPLGWYFKDILITESSSTVAQESTPSVTFDSVSSVQIPAAPEASDDVATTTTAQTLTQPAAESTLESIMPQPVSTSTLPDVYSDAIALTSTVDNALQPSTDYPSTSYVYSESDVQPQSAFANTISTVGVVLTVVTDTGVTANPLPIVVSPTQVTSVYPEPTDTTTTALNSAPKITTEITTQTSLLPPGKDPSDAVCLICVCRNSSEQVSDESLQVLQEYLTVDKRTLSATTRKYISVEDNRPSAIALGFSGILFLCLAGLLLSVNDIISVFSYCYCLYRSTNMLEPGVRGKRGMGTNTLVY